MDGWLSLRVCLLSLILSAVAGCASHRLGQPHEAEWRGSDLAFSCVPVSIVDRQGLDEISFACLLWNRCGFPVTVDRYPRSWELYVFSGAERIAAAKMEDMHGNKTQPVTLLPISEMLDGGKGVDGWRAPKLLPATEGGEAFVHSFRLDVPVSLPDELSPKVRFGLLCVSFSADCGSGRRLFSAQTVISPEELQQLLVSRLVPTSATQ